MSNGPTTVTGALKEAPVDADKVNSDITSVTSDHTTTSTERQFSDKSLEKYDVGEETKPSDQSQQITETPEKLRKEVECILNTYFKDREFDIAKFVRLEGVDDGCDNIKHCDIFKNEFDRTREAVSQLLDAVTTSDSAVGGGIAIRLDYDEIIDAHKRVASNPKLTANDTAYKLYKELGNLIRSKMVEAEKSGCTIKDKRILDDRLYVINRLQDIKMQKADAILGQNFSGTIFDFEKFAEINDIDIDPSYKPLSGEIINSFAKMHIIAYSLLRSGITFDKGTEGSVTIKLTADEVINAWDCVAMSRRLTPNEKAYKLYSELGNLIHGKLLDVVKDEYFVKTQKDLCYCLSTSYNLCKSFLSLPLVNFDEGMELCKRMIKTFLVGPYSVYNLSVDTLSDGQKLSPEYQALVKEFQKLGVFFAFKNMELGEQALPFLKFIASLGMKLPLFMAEITTSGLYLASSYSYDLVGVVIHEVTAKLQFRNLPESHHSIAHEITHHARSAVGAMYIDQSIAFQNLADLLAGHDDVILAIKSQVENYALTNPEEYIACFSALVLCILECKENPFDYIPDGRLWRLYYEFGGPDFIPVINERFLRPRFGRDILSETSLNWLPGYPSKFSVDIGRLRDNNISIAGTMIGLGMFVTIDANTILPPPPLGYCYTTENGKLQLKVDKNVLPKSADDALYDPVFCSLTNGPLTLMKTNPQLVRHFELLRNATVI